jgi:hypothetical protein
LPRPSCANLARPRQDTRSRSWHDASTWHPLTKPVQSRETSSRKGVWGGQSITIRHRDPDGKPRIRADIRGNAIRTLQTSQPMPTSWDHKRERWPRDAVLRLDHLPLTPMAATKIVDAGLGRNTRTEPRIFRRRSVTPSTSSSSPSTSGSTTWGLRSARRSRWTRFHAGPERHTLSLQRAADELVSCSLVRPASDIKWLINK